MLRFIAQERQYFRTWLFVPVPEASELRTVKTTPTHVRAQRRWPRKFKRSRVMASAYKAGAQLKASSIPASPMDRLLSVIVRLLLYTFSFASFAVFIKSRLEQRRVKVPPGPRLEPFIGGFRSMPSSYLWLTFADWSYKWGLSINDFTCSHIIDSM